MRWRRLIWLGAILVVSASSAPASTENVLTSTGVRPGEVIEFKTTGLKDGAPYWQGRYAYSTIQRDGQTLLRQTGRYTFPNGNHAEEESLLLPQEGRLLPRSFSLTVTNPSGKVIRTERMTFDATARKVRVIRTYDDPTGQDDNGVTDQMDRWIEVPPHTYPRPMFDAVLRKMELPKGARYKINCITRLGEVYGIILTEDGTEQITTPAGKFDTVRVRLIPDIPLLPKLMPSLTIRLWYTRETPRLPVKFEGYPQPPPPRLQNEVRMEVTHLERGAMLQEAPVPAAPQRSREQPVPPVRSAMTGSEPSTSPR